MRFLLTFFCICVSCLNASVINFPSDKGLGTINHDPFDSTLLIEQVTKQDSFNLLHFVHDYDTANNTIQWKKEFAIDSIMSFRFIFKFDSIYAGAPRSYNKKGGEPHFNLLTIISDYLLDKPYIESFINLGMLYKNNKWYLYTPVAVNGGGHKKHPLYELHKNSIYGMEITAIINKDSTISQVKLSINDSDILFPFQQTGKKISNFICQIGAIEKGFDIRGQILIGNIAFGNHYIGLPPSKPILPTTTQPARINGNGTITLFNSPQTASVYPRYQIKSADTNSRWFLPVYDSGIDSVNKDSIVVPILLSNASRWVYRVKHYASHGNMSEWSDPAPITIAASDTTATPLIVSAIFHDKENNHDVNILTINKWYDLVVKTSFPKGFKDKAIMLFWVNSEDYTLGTPANKGGRYLAASSYIYNFSFSPDKAFEKNIEGKFRSQRLIDTSGSYIDFRTGSYSLNEKESSAKFRVRIREGTPGFWSLRGVAYDRSNNMSPVYMSTFRLSHAQDTARKSFNTIYFLLTISGILIIIFIAIMRKRTKKPEEESKPPTISTYDRELFDKLHTYLKENTEKELKVGGIEDALGISHGSLYLLVKKLTGKTLKQLILEVKMDKAKEFFEKTDMNVTEVMYKVGFSSPSHFTKIFRKHTGINPKQFSKL